ncbi:MAG: hypothetical protein KJP10_10005 [Gammaproteobacteria bacterium]|nr:hypothetical protein [Gammaproteobacteria bacterium]
MLLVKANTVEARLKYYRYNADIPMVEMSLNMMVAMGVLDQIPGRLVHDGNPYHNLANRRYRHSSRYPYASPVSARYSSRYRYDDYWDEPYSRYDDYWDEPSSRYDDYWDQPYSYFGNYRDEPRHYRRYARSRYGYEPYRNRWRSRDSLWADRWSDPSYRNWSSPGFNRYGYGYPWNTAWSNPWGNSWSYPWMNPWSSPYAYLGSWPYTSVYPSTPLSTDSLQGYTRPDTQNNTENSSHNNNDSRGSEQPVWFGQPSRVSYDRGAYRSDNSRYRRLNGLWIGNQGEMLGIRGDRFLWYDDRNQYAIGRLSKSPSMMKARVDGTSDVISYHYRLSGDELVIMSRDGKMRVFNRMPLLKSYRGMPKPRAAYSSYQPESESSYFSHSSYQSVETDSSSSSVSEQSQTAAEAAASGASRYNANVLSGQANLHVHDFLDDSAVITVTPNNRETDAVRSTPGNIKAYTHTQPLTGGPSSAAGNRYFPQQAFSGSGSDDIWKPLTPYSTRDANDDAAPNSRPVYQAYRSVVIPYTSSNDNAAESANARSASAGKDINDPNTYLYSYMKDSNSSQVVVTPRSWNNGAGAAAAFANPGNGFAFSEPAVVMQDDGSNIWKPNNSLARRQHNPGPSASYPAQATRQSSSAPASNSEVRKFNWSNRSWN